MTFLQNQQPFSTFQKYISLYSSALEITASYCIYQVYLFKDTIYLICLVINTRRKKNIYIHSLSISWSFQGEKKGEVTKHNPP